MDAHATSSCVPCDAGRFSDSGLACEFCPRGFYASEKDQQTCKACSAATAGVSWCHVLPASTSDSLSFKPANAKLAAIMVAAVSSAVNGPIIVPNETITSDIDRTQQDLGASSTAPSQVSGLHVFILIVSLLALASHRFWPRSCSKLDLLFSRNHKVANEHAVREMQSRLGVACLLVFVLVAIGLVVNAYNTLNEHTSSALEQMTSEKLKEFSHAADQTQLQMRAGTDPGTFGALVVTVDAVSSDVMYDCSSRQIQPTTRDGSDGSAVLGCAWAS